MTLLFLYAFCIPVFFSLTVTPWVISRCESCGLVDHPDERKNHSRPTAMTGGIVLFPITIAALAASLYGNSRLPFIVLAVSLIFAVGILDDLRNVHFTVKFGVQITAAIIIVLSGIHIDLANLSLVQKLNITMSPGVNEFLSLLVTVFWIVALTNALNLIDGIDGLASGLSLNALIGMAALGIAGGKGGAVLVSLILAGGVLGFMRYNLYPARTFLGDSGSLLLGFTIAVIAIIQSAKTTTMLILVIPVLFLAIPMLDTVMAFLRRAARLESPFKADREHLHHRLLELNFTQRQTLAYFYSFSAFLGLTALWFAQSHKAVIIMLAVVTVAVMVGIIKSLQIFDLHRTIGQINNDMRTIGRMLMGQELEQGYGAGSRTVLMILLFTNIFFALAGGGGGRNVVIAGSGLVAAIGLIDRMSLSRSEDGYRGAMLGVSIFFLLLIGQLTLLVSWHPTLLREGRFPLITLLLLLIGGIFISATKSFMIFFDEPFEILVLFLGVVLSCMVKHYTGAASFMPFVAVLLNSAVLYFLLKIILRRPSLRYHVLGTSIMGVAFFVVLFG